MNRARSLTGFVFAALILAAGLVAQPAWAGPQIFSSDVTLQGTYLNEPGRGASPFIIQVFAIAGQCLNLEVTVEDTDLEMIVMTGEGSVYRNDDSAGGCFLCPRVKVDPTPDEGWYTVHISHFSGAGPALANFTLLYQRFGSGNAACSSPTPALTPGGPETQKARQ